jgi:hypothetical protein
MRIPPRDSELFGASYASPVADTTCWFAAGKEWIKTKASGHPTSQTTKALARGRRHDLGYQSFENRESALIRGAVDIQADGWLGEGFRAEPQLGAEALEEQKKDGHEHIYKRNYLKDATLPGQNK